MINKINAISPNIVGFKQNQNYEYPAPKSKLSAYKDAFIQSSKSMLPSNIALGIVFAFLNARKDMSKLGSALVNNLVLFTGISVIISAVDSAFRIKPNRQ